MRPGIRNLTGSQCIFVLAVYDVETLRMSLCYPSALPEYFVNASINENVHLLGCLEAVADAVSFAAVYVLITNSVLLVQAIQRCKAVIGAKIVDHALDEHTCSELKSLIVLACHRIKNTRDIAFNVLDKLITGFPSLICDSELVFALLDVLTLLQQACDGRLLDEVCFVPA